MSNKEIAHKLHRSTRTIEDHRNHVMNKLGVHNVVDLVKVALKMKITEKL
jgi:DNA-binding NarL/FixJ family response regulator